MDFKEFYNDISLLIAKEWTGGLTDEEAERLQQWRLEDERHEKIYRRTRTRFEEGKTRIYDRKEIIVSDWKKVRSRIGEADKRNKRIGIWVRYAAVLLILLGVGGLLNEWGIRVEEQTFQVVRHLESESSKAILTLNDGEQFPLHEQEKDSIRSGEIIIENRSGQLIYDTNTLICTQMLYHTVTVPQGGEYRITLSDGTRVWMNAETCLTYPVVFVGKERRVVLSGEAYFEVSKNPEKPFFITAGDIDIKVVGTSFNVNAYHNEANIVTTLVEGKVCIREKERLLDELQPSEQAVWSKKTRELHTRPVDVSAYIQWLKGDFSFWDDDLETIMRILARWYDIEYVFEDEGLKKERFYGVLSRYEEVGELLEQFEKTGKVHFQYQGKKISIKKST